MVRALDHAFANAYWIGRCCPLEERETGSLARGGLFVVLVPDNIERFTGGVECQTIFLYQDILHYNALAGPLDDAGTGCAISPGCDLGGQPDCFAIGKAGKATRELLKKRSTD